MRKLNLYLCWNISILFFIKYSSAIEYDPPSRVLNITEGSNAYTFGIKEDNSTSITRCYYTSDTGLNDYFNVTRWDRMMNLEDDKNNMQPFHKNSETRANNILGHHGLSGQCLITIRWPDNEGPNEWILTPFDNVTGANLSSIIYRVNFYNKGYLVENKIILSEQASFFNYIMNTTQDITLCTLTFNNTIIELDLNSNAVTSYSWETEEILNRLSSLGQGLCGFKYNNASQVINSLEWTLTATDIKGKFYQGTFKTTVVKKKNFKTKIEVALGNRFNIECGESYNNDFCYLFNPSGKLVETQRCIYQGDMFTMEDVGIWRCNVGNSLSMESNQYAIELVKIPDDTAVTTWFNETNDYVNIGCQLNDYNRNFEISLCKMITPSLQVLNLRPSGATARYLSIGTDYKKRICSLQIPKPLQEIENGMWQCEITIGATVTGRFIQVNKTKNIEYPKYLEVVTRLNEPFRVSCHVPYSSEFCAIRSPNGEQYLNELDFVPQLGRCSLTVTNTSTVSSNAGNWSCTFAQKIGVPDDKITVEVKIIKDLVSDETVFGSLGGLTRLMCHTNGLPLKYCRFKNPLGKTYHIHNHKNSTSLSYYGKGIEYGECGINILHTQPEDFGRWVCMLEITGYANVGSGQLSDTILVLYGNNK